MDFLNNNTSPISVLLSQSLTNTNKQLNFLKEQAVKNVILINFRQIEYSNTYSPFSFFNNDRNIIDTCKFLEKELKFNTKPEILLLEAVMFYLAKYRPKEEQNFVSIIKLLNAAEFNEGNSNTKSSLDRIFDEVEKRDFNSAAFRAYSSFKQANVVNQKYATANLLSSFNDFISFNLVESFCWKTNWDLNDLINKKTPLLVCLPDKNDSLYFYAKLFIYQIFEHVNSINLSKLDESIKLDIIFDDSVKDDMKNFVLNLDVENKNSVRIRNLENKDLVVKNNEKLFLNFSNIKELEEHYEEIRWKSESKKELENEVEKIKQISEKIKEKKKKKEREQ